MNKEYDLILNMLGNPTFGSEDFLSVGYTAENTALRSKEEYLSSTKITEDPLLQDAEGNFDKTKFDNLYALAALYYNEIASQDYYAEFMKLAEFSKDNIWAAPELRTLDFTPKLIRVPNERLVTNSIELIGKRGSSKLSDLEIAQTQPVYDSEKDTWGISPNEGFFDYFMDTLVLATYDEDIYDEYGNLIHVQGEKKLNLDGLPYYEKLNGRDIYNKQVLNKLNVLTTDGSWINDYDFFDTDDLEQKSLTGSIFRNLALVGSMFIPGIGSYITGLSVGINILDILSTMGKMVDNDNESLNNFKGWIKSIDRSSSTEEALSNTWCGENFINMMGETAGLLAELRWLFKAVPTAIKRDKNIYKVLSGKSDEVAKSVASKSKNVLEGLLTKDTKVNGKILGTLITELGEQNTKKAYQYIDDLIASASKIGSPFSKAYMIGLVSLDMYGEALNAGASETEAAFLTLGYAIGEGIILNTPLGEWILPELKNSKFKNETIAKAIVKEILDAYKNAPDKKTFAKTLINVGNKIWKNSYSEAVLTGKKTIASIALHGAKESLEEVTEEFWADLSKSLFNAYRWLNDEKGLDMHLWDNIFDRYTMSALGGFIGGGLASAGTSFSQAKHLASLDRTKALLELIYLVNNGKEGEFIKNLNNMTLGNKSLSSDDIIGKEGEYYLYGAGTSENNLDKMLKQLIINEIKMIKDILKSEGALISKESLLNKLTNPTETLHNIKLNNLQKSISVKLYLLDFALLQNDIITTKAELLSLQPTDSGKDNEVNLGRKKELEGRLKELNDKKKKYLNGEINPEIIRTIVYEINPALHNNFTLSQFVKTKTGKDWNTLSKEERKNVKEKYIQYAETDMKLDIKESADMYWDMLKLFSPVVKTFDFKNRNTKLLGTIESLLKIRSGEDQVKYLEEVLNILNQVEEVGIFELSGFTEDNIDKFQIKKSALLNLDKIVKDFIKVGYIHPETKKLLLDIINLLNKELPDIISNVDFNEMIQLEDVMNNINNYKQQIERLNNTPIIEYLNKFQLATTNSSINLFQHLDYTLRMFDSNKKDIDKLTFDSNWEEANEEALTLVNAFILVVRGLLNSSDINNPTGYSELLNNLYKNLDLAVIDSKEAEILITDAILIKQRLEFAKELYYINSGRKLNALENLAKHTNKLLTETCERFINVCIPDDWEEKEIIKALIQSSKHIVLIEDAIYEMFLKHGLDNLEEMLRKFAGTNGFFLKTGNPVTENTEYIENNAFIWWLATRVALKSSDFYGAYVKAIQNDIAPIDSQLQGIYMGVAAISNMNILNKFREAYEKVIILEFNELDPESRKKLLNDFDGSGDLFATKLFKYFASHDVVPQYNNIVFFEGIPGSGKSFGIFQSIIKSLIQLDVLKDSWYVHALKLSADEATEKMNFKAITYDRTSFMKEISAEWKDATNNKNNLYKNSYEFVNGKLVNKWKLKARTSYPKVVFVDELSRYNLLEIAMMSQWASENGIVIIAAGDLDLSKLIAHVNVEGESVTVKIARNNFIRTWKLGLSLRTLNKQMTYNINMTLAAIQRIRDKESVELLFHYLDNDEKHPGLFGVKTRNTVDNFLFEDIDNMFKTATEKVGFIYHDTNSELYKYITEKYSDKILPFKDDDAQGLEALYYIIDNNTELNKNTEEWISNIYTGISRAKQGAIILSTTVNSKLDPIYKLEPIPKEDIEKVALRKREELNNLITLGIIKPSNIEIKSIVNKKPKVTKKISPEKVESKKLNTSKLEELEPLDKGIPTGLENDPEIYEETITDTNLSEEKSILPFYSFLMFEDIFEQNLDGSYINYFDRIDGLYGLVKIFYGDIDINTLNEDEIYDLLNKLALIQSYIRYDNWNDVYKLLFGENVVGDIELRWGIKSSSLDSKIDRYRKGISSVEESARKKVIVVIKHNNKSILEIPICSLPSPMTLIQKFPEVYPNCYDAFFSVFNDEELNFYEAVNNVLNTVTSKEEKTMVNLFRLWLYDSDGIFYFGKYNVRTKKFNPISTNLNLQLTGPKLIQHAGDYLLNGEWEFSDIQVPLSKFTDRLDLIVSSPLGTNKSLYGIRPGNTFVLVSDDLTLQSDEDLVNLFIALQENPEIKLSVSLFYVIPPKVNSEEWLESLHNSMIGIRSTRHIGNLLTAYRILQGVSNLPKHILGIIDKLDSIETKWNEESIKFDKQIFDIDNNYSDESYYEELKENYGEKYARYYSRILEQLRFIEAENNINYASIPANKSSEYILNWYIHNLCYSPENQEDLLDISKHKRNNYKLPEIQIHLVSLFTNIKNNIGPFAKMEKLNYSISGKIETSIINIPNFEQYLEFITKLNKDGKPINFYFKDTWKMTSVALENFEDDYLDKLKPVIHPIENKYRGRYNLNFSLIDSNKSDFENLKLLAEDYNNNHLKEYAYIYNNELFIEKIPIELKNASPILEDIKYDVNGNKYTTVIGKNGFELNQITKISLTSNNSIDENYFKEFKNNLKSRLKGLAKNKLKYLTECTSLEKLNEELNNWKTTGKINNVEVSETLLESDLKWAKDENILNYIISLQQDDNNLKMICKRIITK